MIQSQSFIASYRYLNRATNEILGESLTRVEVQFLRAKIEEISEVLDQMPPMTAPASPPASPVEP